MQAVTFRIYQYEQVKHTPLFFGNRTHPLFIRITQSAKSLNFKSHCFDQLLKPKYQHDVLQGGKTPTLQDIIRLETQLIEFLINKQKADFILPHLKQAYDFYSHDVLDKLEEEFKQYLVAFFYKEDMPSMACLVDNYRTKLRADQLLNDLKRLLSTQVYNRMMGRSLLEAPPYIPLLEFCRLHYPNSPGLLLTFQFCQERFKQEFHLFIRERYPAYLPHDPYEYVISRLKTSL
ncbi:MAG: hypothetical protein INR73_20080 [Williamsia sp.]|nr:hypothetical protein [Williamsia sp.]